MPIVACCGLRPEHLSPQLQKAAVEQGTAAAGKTLPKWPDRCKQATPHADADAAPDLHAALKLEARQLDKANGDKGWCALFYGNLQKGLAK